MSYEISKRNLAKYFAHGVKCIYGGDLCKVIALHNEYATIKISNQYYKDLEYDAVIPVLRSLKDLGKEITHNNETFIPILKLTGAPNMKNIDINVNGVFIFRNERLVKEILFHQINLEPNIFVTKLVEWGFDVDGLIEKKLAKDINEYV